MADDAVRRSSEVLHQYVAGESTLADALTRIATIAVDTLHAEMAGLTLLRPDGRAVTAVYVDDEVMALDQSQYDADRGPCLEAFRTKQVIRLGDATAEARWPEFADAARQHRIYSSLSLPLIVGDDGIGALNLYARDRDHFPPEASELGMEFAGQSAIAVANAKAYWEQASLAQQLQSALESRAVIEQAKGVIMSNMGCTADEAFDLLRQQSQAENVKLRDVAAEIVARQARRHS